MVAVSHKFSIAPIGEISDRIKKVRGAKSGTYLLYQTIAMPSMVGIAGCRRKSVMFLSVGLSRFGITMFVITETV